METHTAANFVLVHGTFASRAGWVRADSLLCQGLGRRYPDAEFFPFEWSGGNSHAARIAAGRRLAEFLQNLRDRSPGRQCFVIAHSHGGNVVLHAMSQPAAEACVDGCVFLGTPFINARPRELDLFLRTLAFQLTWLVAYAPITILLIPWLGLTNALIASIAVALFAILFATSVVAEAEIKDPIYDALSAKLFTEQERFLHDVTPAPLRRPSLTCYVPGDEARAWLDAINFTSRAPFVVTDYLLQFVQTWPILFVGAVVLGALDWVIGERDAFAMRGMFAGLMLLFAGLILVVIMSLVIPLVSVVVRAHRLGFGWEGLLGYSLVDLFTTLQPPCAAGATSVAIAAPPRRRLGKGLRHSGFYVDADVVESIGDWLEQPGRGASTPLSDSPVAPHAFESARAHTDTILFRCMIATVAVLILGTCWSRWQSVHYFRDIPAAVTHGDIRDLTVLFPQQTLVLGPGQEQTAVFDLHRPSNGLTSYLMVTYGSDSVEGHLFTGLTRGPDEWESVSIPSCGFKVRRAFSGGLGRRQFTVGRRLEFGAGSTIKACVSIKNHGKKTEANIDLQMWLEYF